VFAAKATAWPKLIVASIDLVGRVGL